MGRIEPHGTQLVLAASAEPAVHDQERARRGRPNSGDAGDLLRPFLAGLPDRDLQATGHRDGHGLKAAAVDGPKPDQVPFRVDDVIDLEELLAGVSVPAPAEIAPPRWPRGRHEGLHQLLGCTPDPVGPLHRTGSVLVKPAQRGSLPRYTSLEPDGKLAAGRPVELHD